MYTLLNIRVEGDMVGRVPVCSFVDVGEVGTHLVYHWDNHLAWRSGFFSGTALWCYTFLFFLLIQ